MKLFHFLLFALVGCVAGARAQYAPQVSVSGTTAISKNSTQLVAWATGCTVQRGYIDIAQPALGRVSAGDSSLALGMANNTVVSLGDSGVATLSFAHPIVNGAGYDFAVFENGFPNPANAEEAFLELAFVEVSSDGLNFVRFPSASLTQDSFQISSIAGQNYMDARKVNNLAGKYISNYGTPFDLQELSGIPGLDINHITHLRIVDVIGRLDGHSSFDAVGRKINDPYPTDFPIGGFDLDAVGVIHQAATAVATDLLPPQVRVFPNPATDVVYIRTDAPLRLWLADVSGKVLRQLTISGDATIPCSELQSGLYFLHFEHGNGVKWAERFVKH